MIRSSSKVGGSYQFWLLKGIKYRKGAKFKNAVGAFQKAVMLKPDQSAAGYLLGLSQLEKAIALKPNDPHAWQKLGEIHFHLKEIPSALNCFSQALSLDPKNKKIKEWIKKAELSFQPFPINEEERLKLGLSLYAQAKEEEERGNQKEALKLFNQVLFFIPDHLPTVSRMAKIYLEQKDLAQAVSICESYLKDHPPEITFLLLLSKIYHQQRRHQEARAVSKKIITLAEKKAKLTEEESYALSRAFFNLAHHHYYQGKLNLARKLARKASEVDPKLEKKVKDFFREPKKRPY